ncbi:5-dehydro-4-deoxy-D-glucuronate isomerase [Cytobacillus purgationiresistens]|uniref:5-dehydro-4-deoxy-D-glucuronate isomerase n=1 Tax=Cytobacillus purgationiresistens TaxID=863449 RepID=UPI0027D845D9|nr:5-dehydro-4-deoxy-D-glucuronate isomerase [Cytobacillus purgationiresistens]
MDKRYSVHPTQVKQFDTEELRQNFLLENLFIPDKVSLCYSLDDRIIIGGITPVETEVKLKGSDVIKADYFLERRELGVFNIGGPGKITVDGDEYEMDNRDCLYIGLGSKQISFASNSATEHAKYYLASAPAHRGYPIQHVAFKDVPGDEMGEQEKANKRKIRRMIHQNGIQSCQLCMGMTELESGSVWNSMPPHVHDRRVEVYLYFDLPKDEILFHMMGEPQETRHLIMQNEQAVLSPPWSIHCGAATSSYTFIWAMAGENYTYEDMDKFPIIEMK